MNVINNKNRKACALMNTNAHGQKHTHTILLTHIPVSSNNIPGVMLIVSDFYLRNLNEGARSPTHFHQTPINLSLILLQFRRSRKKKVSKSAAGKEGRCVGGGGGWELGMMFTTRAMI